MSGSHRLSLPGKALSLISSFLSPSSRRKRERSTTENDTSNLEAPPQPSEKQPIQRGVTAVIFSKDRPGQLLACVSSAFLYIKGVNDWRIIYNCSNPESDAKYREAFARLRVLAGPNWANVHIIRESASITFGDAVKQVLGEDVTTPYVWFQVDDAVHFAPIELDIISDTLAQREDILGVHTKLWPGVTLCESGAQSREMKVPSFTPIDSVSGFKLNIFKRQEGTLDWNYAFDVSGGLYRMEDVRSWIQKVETQAISSPNQFELTGNEQWAAMSIVKPWSVCLESAAFSILAVNRVQTDFPENKVFDSNFLASNPWEELTQSLFTQGLDLEKYRSTAPSRLSVHTGDVYLNKSLSVERLDASVLLPCKNAERTLIRALRSVLEQECGDFTIEIIVVDDCSTDASAFIVEQMHDKRLRLVRRPHSSGKVADCLDYGLKYCRGEVIIRMDADDEMLPGRIKAQIEYMRDHPHVGVVGCQTIILKEGTHLTSQERNKLLKGIKAEIDQRYAPCPSGCAFLAWSLYFYCPLVHPAVCIRRQALEDAHGYSSEATLSSEDYSLWYRIQLGNWTLENLPTLGLIHYKNASSVTSSWSRHELFSQSAELAHRGFQHRRLNCEVATKDEWATICGDSQKDTLEPSAVTRICDTLDALKNSIIAEYQHIATAADLDRVSSDCEARKLEVKARQRS